jgi:alcohol/geraniol dehydrogenase (NADP+)
VTSGEELDWGSYLGQLDSGGALVLVAITFKPMSMPVLPLIGKQRRVMASLIGSRASINEMLGIAARKEVRPIIETFPLAQANEAVLRVRENKVRYRAVLQS